MNTRRFVLPAAALAAVLALAHPRPAPAAAPAPGAAPAPVPHGAAAMSDDTLHAALTAITRDVLEAIRTGDRARLARHLAPDMLLINRDGRESSRQEFLDALVPPREGYDLGFEIVESRTLARGEAALFTFLLAERLVIFGHDVSTTYRNHLLYHRLDGAWKLALYTYWEQPATPPAAPADTAALDALTGTYALAPGKWVTRITREGTTLRMQRDGGPVRELVPVAGGRFHVRGVEAEYFFEPGPDGRAAAFVFRRNWKDLRHARVD